MTATHIVIPCFNEAERFSSVQAQALLEDHNLHIVLVDDGSTDNTVEVLRGLSDAYPEQVKIVELAVNVGKAEAVRQGMLAALESGAAVTGYLDADFATPAAEMKRLIQILHADDDIEVLLGARWLHLGADIERRPLRHYGGRIFATFASMVLNLQVYDTQCGAKLFRNSSALKVALGAKFVSKWAFDVELIGRLRLQLATTAFREIPLYKWVDVAGSKISFFDMIRATLALLQIRRALIAFRRATRTS